MCSYAYTDDEWNCGDGYCIDVSEVCDGYYDCLNGTDEIACGKLNKTVWIFCTTIHNPLRL